VLPPLRPLGLPIYVARIPALHSSPLPPRLALILALPLVAPATLAALPSTRAIETRFFPALTHVLPPISPLGCPSMEGVPRGSISRYPPRLCLDPRTPLLAPATLAAWRLPGDSNRDGVLCRFPKRSIPPSRRFYSLIPSAPSLRRRGSSRSQDSGYISAGDTAGITAISSARKATYDR